jgi:hypothetical protein
MESEHLLSTLRVFGEGQKKIIRRYIKGLGTGCVESVFVLACAGAAAAAQDEDERWLVCVGPTQAARPRLSRSDSVASY